MIYRVIADLRMIQGICLPGEETHWQWVIPPNPKYREMVGAGTCFGPIMNRHGLPAPPIRNPRARFYFTESGWNKVGRFVAAYGRKKGFIMQVIRRKNPPASQIIYQDNLQVALLPSNIRKTTAKARKPPASAQLTDTDN